MNALPDLARSTWLYCAAHRARAQALGLGPAHTLWDMDTVPVRGEASGEARDSEHPIRCGAWGHARTRYMNMNMNMDVCNMR
eukprot:1982696-Prymnesium_polylepis.1